jgi:hypothetical protein
MLIFDLNGSLFSLVTPSRAKNSYVRDYREAGSLSVLAEKEENSQL